jgi:predicted TIM-barrel enzyme
MALATAAGAPRAALAVDAPKARGRRSAAAGGGGFQACIVENFGDAPFHGTQVEPVTVAVMSRIVSTLRREVPALVVGVNVLRNDAAGALAVAAAAGAGFVRVNVHVGATATDQGILEGRAAETLRLRQRLGCKPSGPTCVKHGEAYAHECIATRRATPSGAALPTRSSSPGVVQAGPPTSTTCAQCGP